jgi:transcriptional regulator with XRE-family HTH domain
MNRLAELRERHALTLRELAEMSGVAADTINQIELGHRKARPSTLRKLAKALGIEVRELFEEPALSGKAEAPPPGPLSPEWALRVGPDRFRQTIQDISTEHLQSLFLDFVSKYQPQTLEDLAKASPEEVYRRVVDFSFADIVNEELVWRGEKPSVASAAVFKRYQNALSNEANEATQEAIISDVPRNAGA